MASPETQTTVLIFGGIAVAVALCIAIVVSTGKKRIEALEKVATAMGFSFERKGDAFRSELDKNLHLLKLGSFGKLNNVMRGPSAAGAITLFEYRYTEGGGEEQRKRHQTVAAFHLPDCTLPEFHLGAEHWWQKLGKTSGYKVIQFETHPEFGKRYLLRGTDEDAVRQFFQPPLLDYFQSLPEKPVWNVEAAATWLLVYLPTEVRKPDQLRAFRDAAATAASNVMAGAGIRRTGSL